MASRLENFNNWSLGTFNGTITQSGQLKIARTYTNIPENFTVTGAQSVVSEQYVLLSFLDDDTFTLTGTYVHTDPTSVLDVYLGDKRIGGGTEQVTFTAGGHPSQYGMKDDKLLYLRVKSQGNSLSTSGFYRSVSGATSGTWTSPWFQLRPFDLQKLQASLQHTGTAPSLEFRSNTAAQTTGASSWNTSVLFQESHRFYQIRTVLQADTVISHLSFRVDTLYPEPEVGWEGSDIQAFGQGLSYIPNMQVLLSGQDVTKHVAQVTDGSVTLAYRKGEILHSLSGAELIVMLDGEILSKALVSGFTQEKHTQSSRIQVNTLHFKDILGASVPELPSYEDPELEWQDREMVSIGHKPGENPMPDLPFQDESGFMTYVLGNSPGTPKLLMNSLKKFRHLDFWSAPNNTLTGDGGLGFENPADWMQHYGKSNKVGLDILEQVANANLMHVTVLDNGDVMLSDLIPVPDKDLTELVKGQTVEGETVYLAYHRFHEDENRNYLPDYRLSVSDIQVNEQDVQPVVKVQGTSGPKQTIFQRQTVDCYMLQSNGGSSKESKMTYEGMHWGAVSLGGKPRVEGKFTFTDSKGTPIAVKEGTLEYFSEFGVRNGDWRVEFTPMVGTLSYQDTDNDGNPVGDDDDVTGVTGLKVVAYMVSNQFGRADMSLSFRVKGKWLVQPDLPTKDLIGEPSIEYVPKWFPILLSESQRLRSAYGFEDGLIDNPYIVSLQNYGAVQDQEYWRNMPEMVSTGLTLREILSSRTVNLTYVGNANWTPDQFVTVARRPTGGVGQHITLWDVYFTLDTPTFNIQVGSEVRTSIQAAYVGTVHKDLTTGEWSVLTHDPLEQT